MKIPKDSETMLDIYDILEKGEKGGQWGLRFPK